MRFRGEVRWFYLPPTLLKCVRIGEKADCTHAIQTVLLLRNPLRIRPRRVPQPQPSPCLYPSPPSLQHHSSRSDPLRPFPHHQYLPFPPNLTTIYTLCSISLQSFLTSLEKRTVESTLVIFSSVTGKRKGNEELDSTRIELAWDR